MLYEYLPEELPPVLTVEQLRAFLGIGRNAAYTLVHSDRHASCRPASWTPTSYPPARRLAVPGSVSLIRKRRRRICSSSAQFNC